jgi:hypothetical protein
VASVGFRPAGRPGLGAAACQRHDQHRQAQRVRQQDEPLPLLVALLAGRGEELDTRHPLLGREVHLAHEGMGVFHQRLHHLLEARVLAVRHAVDHRLREVTHFQWGHGSSPAFAAAV